MNNKFYISTGLYSQRAFDVLNSICESYELVYLSSQRNVIKKNFLRTDVDTLIELENIKTKLNDFISEVSVAIDYSTHEVILVPYAVECADDIEDDIGLSKNEMRNMLAEAIEFFAKNMKSDDVVELPDFREPVYKSHKFVVRDARIVADVMLGKNVKDKYAKKDINAVVGIENDVLKQEMIESLEEEIASSYDKFLKKLGDIDDEVNKNIVKLNQEAQAAVNNLYVEKDKKVKCITKEIEKHIADCRSQMSKFAGMNSKNKKKFFDIKNFDWVHVRDNMMNLDEHLKQTS